MFTPIGFFAPPTAADGIPTADLATYFYSANQTTIFTDQSGNGNDGTEVVVGSGGYSAITHYSTSTPYWELTSTNPTLETRYIDTGVQMGDKRDTDKFTYVVIFSLNILTVSQRLWRCDNGFNRLINGNTNRSSYYFAVPSRTNEGPANALINTSPLSLSTWYMFFVSLDGAGTYSLYDGSGLIDSDSFGEANLSTNIRIGADTLSSTTANDYKLAAHAYYDGIELNATQRTDLYNYYNAIYSF